VSVEPKRPSGPEIENLLAERRTFPPDPSFTAQANAKAGIYDEAERDFVAFWERLARERISWTKPFETTLEWELPFAKWFVGGELNIAYNCLDRHVEAGLGDKVAYHWIGEPGDTRTLTYADLLREVSKAANALRELGVGMGDRVAIYMPMIPELGGGAVGADQRLRRKGPAHGRRGLPPGEGRRAQAPRRRGDGVHPVDRSLHRRQPHRPRGPHGRGA
jgi:hypothetical protein